MQVTADTQDGAASISPASAILDLVHMARQPSPAVRAPLMDDVAPEEELSEDIEDLLWGANDEDGPLRLDERGRPAGEPVSFTEDDLLAPFLMD